MYFLDTDTCVFLLRGRHPDMLERLRQVSPALISVPAVVAAELYFGAARAGGLSARKAVDFFLEPLTCAAFDKASADVYGHLRLELGSRGLLIGSNDMLIAATVLSRRGILVTHNTAEFSRIPGLKLEDWVLAGG